MTADDIIAANSRYDFKTVQIGRHDGLSYVDEEGKEMWVIWRGRNHVSAPAPWDVAGLKAAEYMLSAMNGGTGSSKRRGRHPIGDRPMTSTERNKRRIARLTAAEVELNRLKGSSP